MLTNIISIAAEEKKKADELLDKEAKKKAETLLARLNKKFKKTFMGSVQ